MKNIFKGTNQFHQYFDSRIPNGLIRACMAIILFLLFHKVFPVISLLFLFTIIITRIVYKTKL